MRDPAVTLTSLDEIAVCIAAFNEEKAVGRVVAGLREVGCAHVIVVDDGSADGTTQAAASAGAHVIRLENNRGQWVALKAAFGVALRTRVKVIVSFDGDGQHDPHAIPRLVEPVLTGRADITVGSRSTKNWYDRDEHRKFGIRALNLLMWGLTGHRFTDCTSGLTAMNANIVVQVLPRLVEPQFGRLEFWLESCKLGARIIEIPAPMRSNPRSHKGQLRFAANLVRTVARARLGSSIKKDRVVGRG